MNWFTKMLTKIGNSFQPAYDRFKNITPDPKVVEIADQIMAVVPEKIAKAFMDTIVDAYKQYGELYATELLKEILNKIKIAMEKIT